MKVRHLAELDALRRLMHARRAEQVPSAEVQRPVRPAAPSPLSRPGTGPHAAPVGELASASFAAAIGPVQRLTPKGRRQHDLPRPQPLPLQREQDERAALRATWSDTVDVESLLLTDDGLGFQRPGLAPDVLARLRRGQWAVQGEIDLHGLRRDEAREALAAFLAEARARGWRCLRVVHGKGHGSPGREPVLKAKVQRWLAQCAAVIAFTQASAPQGGAGALIVLLAGSGTR